MSNIECTIVEAKSILARIVNNHLENVSKKLDRTPQAVMLHSSPGVGKSSITKQIAKELSKSNKYGFEKVGFVDLRLASFEASDVCGIPYVSHADQKIHRVLEDVLAGLDGESKETQREIIYKVLELVQDTEEMKFSIPSWFPTEAKIKAGKVPEVGILFLDELTNAPISVQHAAYRLVLDRAIQDDVVLPAGWLIVGAGNRREDKTGAKSLTPAMANRFGVHLFIQPDVDSFLGYAIGNGLRAEVVGFLLSKPDAIYDYKNALTEAAFAAPRSWEYVSEHLDTGFSNHELGLVLAGCVGTGMATDFLTYMEYHAGLPDWDKVKNGEQKFVVESSNRGLSIAIASSLISILVAAVQVKDLKLRDKYVTNLVEVMKSLDDEFLALIYRSIKAAAGGSNTIAVEVLLATKECFDRVAQYVQVKD